MTLETSAPADSGAAQNAAVQESLVPTPAEAAYDAAKLALHKRLAEFAAHPSIAVEPGTTEYDELTQREDQWFDTVYHGIMHMDRGGDADIIALFDVDQTISEGAGEDRVIRPAFPLVVDALEQALGSRLHVGLLTTVVDHDGQVYPGFFKDVQHREVIDQKYQLSPYTNGLPTKEDREAEARKTIDERLAGVLDVVDPAIVRATKAGAINMDRWHDPDGKLEMVQQLLHQTAAEGASVVFIDNLVPAETIRTDDPRLKGIFVGPFVHSPAWRLGAEANFAAITAARAQFAEG